MKAKITPSVHLAGALKGMKCESGCFLIEELGNEAEAEILQSARNESVSLEPFIVEIGGRYRGEVYPNVEPMSQQPISDADSVEARALWELGFRRKVSRRRAAAGDWIDACEIVN